MYSADIDPQSHSKIMDDTTKILKACVVARKGGVPQDEIDDEYVKYTGIHIPYLKLGFSSLYEFLGSIQELMKVRNQDQQLVYLVKDKKMDHLAKLVENQKNSDAPKITTRWGSRGLFRQNDNRKRKSVYSQRGPTNKKPRNQNGWRRSVETSYSSGEEGFYAENHQDKEFNRPSKIFEKPQRLDVVCAPVINGKQLIGDDFFLQLAIRNLGTPVYRNGPCTALHTGLCKSGQTIAECRRSLKTVQVLANKIVIMLGAEDIYRGRSATDMIQDMEELLFLLESRFAFSKTAITICTLPPLANLSMNTYRKQMLNLLRFNEWIREKTNFSFAHESWNFDSQYNLIDFFMKNTNVGFTTAYEYFQLDARMVSGTRHPYVLWSQQGRRLAINLLRAGS